MNYPRFDSVQSANVAHLSFFSTSGLSELENHHNVDHLIVKSQLQVSDGFTMTPVCVSIAMNFSWADLLNQIELVHTQEFCQ